MCPALNSDWNFITGTWTKTRNAAGNYTMVKTSNAETAYAVLNLAQFMDRAFASATQAINSPLGTEFDAGIMTGFDLIYSVGSGALTSITPAIYETTFVNLATPSVNSTQAQFVLTPTVAPAAQSADATKPTIQFFSMADFWLLGNNIADVQDFIEIVVVDPGGGPTFNLWGIELYMMNRSSTIGSN